MFKLVRCTTEDCLALGSLLYILSFCMGFHGQKVLSNFPVAKLLSHLFNLARVGCIMLSRTSVWDAFVDEKS